MVRGGLTAANLKLVIDPKASPDLKTQQITLCKTRLLILTDKSEIYIPSGDNFRTLLGNSAEAVKQFISEDAVIAPNENMPIVFMPMDASGKIRTQDMLKLTPMKLDARRAFIKSLSKLGGIVIYTWRIFLETYQKRPSQILEYAMWMQKGMEVERYRKESIANPNSIPANNFAMAMDAQRTELCSF
jgi:hypothetical protein